MGVTLDRIDYFQTLNDLRNKDDYTGASHVSDSQAKETVEEAACLAEDTRAWLRAQRRRA